MAHRLLHSISFRAIFPNHRTIGLSKHLDFRRRRLQTDPRLAMLEHSSRIHPILDPLGRMIPASGMTTILSTSVSLSDNRNERSNSRSRNRPATKGEIDLAMPCSIRCHRRVGWDLVSMEERHDEATGEGDDGHCEKESVVALDFDAKDSDVADNGAA